MAIIKRSSSVLLLGGLVALHSGCGSSGNEVGTGSGSGGSATGSASSSGGAILDANGSGGALAQGSGGAVGSGGSGSGGLAAGGSGSGGSQNSGGSAPEGTGGAVEGSGGGPSEEVTTSAGCGQAPSLQSGSITLQSGGTERKYQLRLPDDYDQDHPYRLILGFHGATGNSGQVAPSYFGLWSLSEGSTIFIAPDAVDGLWSSTTDVTFVDDILKQVEDALCIDTQRVQLEGFSQGGAMAWTLACARPDVFQAAVVHSGGGLARPATCAPIAFFSSLGQSESNGAGQTSNSDFFAEQNGCLVESLTKAPSGGHACSDYKDCSDGHPTRWCDYDGGHTPSPTDAGQATSFMPEAVWTFLSQF